MAGKVQKDKLAECLADCEAGLRSDRGATESLWQQVARYCIPREATFTEEVTPGVERNRYILDSTAPRSLELFASFLHTHMNNPATRWLQARVGDVPVEKLSVGMKQWKEHVEDTMLADLASRTGRYYASAHQLYLDEGAFGTGVLFVDMINGRLGVRHYHLADVVIDEDTYGVVDTVYRQFNQTKRQAEQRWPGRDLGQALELKDGKGKPQNVRFMHAVFPTTDEYKMGMMTAKDRNRVAAFPFASVWFNAQDRVTIHVGGFEEFPYMVPRWYKTRGEVYGRSPAMTILPDIRMANRMKETILRGAEKLVDPPLVIRDGGLVTPVRLFPGAVTFTDGEVKIEPLIPPGASRIEYGENLLGSCQTAIREGFFVPLFVTPETPVKTATQVLTEKGERDNAASPMLLRQHDELFHPLGRRVYGCLRRSGRIQPPPEEIGEIGIEYVSPLMSSHKQNEALGTLRMAEMMTPWTQIDANAMDHFDVDAIAKIVHAGSGAPASVLKSEQNVKLVRKARAAQAAQQQAMNALVPAIEAGAKVQTAQAATTRAMKA